MTRVVRRAKSGAEEIAELVLEMTRERGYSVSLRMILDAYEGRFSRLTRASAETTVLLLVKRGVLQRVGGPYRRQYCHTSFPVPYDERSGITRTGQVEDVIINVSRRLQRAVTAREIIEAYHQHYGDLSGRVITHAIATLVRRGIVQKVGGRMRRTQYQHAQYPMPLAAPDDIAVHLETTVAALVTRRGRAVDTSEIVAALRSGGVDVPSSDYVRTRLESLAYESQRKAERAHAEWAKPNLRRVATVSMGGRRRVYWTTLGGPSNTPLFTDASDAVRHAVQRAASEVGRPVSRQDIRVWAGHILSTAADVRDIGAAKVILSRRFPRAMARIPFSDAGRNGRGGDRLITVKTPLSSRGHYPRRFTIGSVTDRQKDLCLLEDLTALLLPTSELESIRVLEESATDAGSQTLLAIAQLRAGLLRERIIRYTPKGSTPELWLAEVVPALLSARRVVESWGNIRHGVSDDEVHGLLHVAEHRRANPGADVASVLEAEGLPIDAFAAIGEAVNVLNGNEGGGWMHNVKHARRIRGALAGGASTSDPDEMRSFYDRPDAVAGMVRMCFLPRMGAAVDLGYSTLGYVLRDERILMHYLEQASRSDPIGRSAVVAALALLGNAPPAELAWPDPSDGEAAMTYLAAVCLAVDDDDLRVRLADEADRRAFGHARTVTEQILARVEAGERLAAVE